MSNNAYKKKSFLGAFVGADSTRGIFVGRGRTGKSFMCFVAIPILCALLMLFNHPGIVLVVWSIIALVLGLSYGGLHVLNGTEEFILSLPLLRRRWYWQNLTFGAAAIFLSTLISVVLIGLDLPQKVWGLFVESGFTEPFGPWSYKFLYPLAVAMPLALFVGTFACASLSRTSYEALLSGLPALVVAGLLILSGFLLEWYFWHGLNGYISVPLGACIPPVAALLGGWGYSRKEVSCSGVSTRRALLLTMLGLLVLVVTLIILLLGLIRGAAESRRDKRLLHDLYKSPITIPAGKSADQVDQADTEGE